jgi:2-haloacid dehalogenase
VKPAAVVFDLFGTLLDISSLTGVAARVSTAPEAFVDGWRAKQVAYMHAAAAMGRYENFDVLTRHALDYTAARLGVRLGREDLDALMSGWQHARAYDDALPALRSLRARGVRTSVLTNATQRTSRSALGEAGAWELVDDLICVDEIETFKPDQAVYRLAVRRLGASPQKLAFVSSNGWDATGACEFGMRVVWCNRAGAPAETFGRPADAVIGSLAELDGAIDALPDG